MGEGFHRPMQERRGGKVCVSVAPQPPLSVILRRRRGGVEPDSRQPTSSQEGRLMLGGPSHNVTEWQEKALFLLLLRLLLLHLRLHLNLLFTLILPPLPTFTPLPLSPPPFSSFLLLNLLCLSLFPFLLLSTICPPPPPSLPIFSSSPMRVCLPPLRPSGKWAVHPAWRSRDQQADSPRRGFCCFSWGSFAFSGAVGGSAGWLAGGWRTQRSHAANLSPCPRRCF